MKLAYLALFLFASCKTTTFYIVRHAEKEPATTMTTDVPLSPAGQQRAAALSDVLQGQGIQNIYSTATNRTTATARPLSNATGVAIQLYDARDMQFLDRIKKHRGAPLLIVGHSNTVDDVVNSIVGKTLLQDLSESQYGHLFVVKIKGKKAELEKERFGE